MMNIFYKKKRDRFTAALVAAFFLQSTLTWSAPAIGVSTPIGSKPEINFQDAINQIYIPQELGIIKEKHIIQDSGYANPSPLIVHIQDAHANYEAQKNIEGIVDYLNRVYGFSLILLEGGFDKLEPKMMQIFKDPKYNAEMVDYLVKKGEVTGAEAFLIEKTYEQNPSQNAGSPMQTYGLESDVSYKQDLEHFRKIWPETENGRLFAKKLSALIDRASSRSMNKDLRGFIKEWMHYKEFKYDLNAYLNTLYKSARANLRLNLSDPRNQKEWPILLRLFKLKEMEPELKADQAREEWEKAKVSLKTFGVQDVLLQEIENRLNGKRVAAFSNEVSTRSLFAQLIDMTMDKGFSFDAYPQLALWVGTTLLRNEVDSEETFEEIDRLNDLILESLSQTEQEKQNVELLKLSYLLKDLFSLELSRVNYNRIVAAPDLFTPAEMIRRIQTIDPTGQVPTTGEIEQMGALFRECMKSYEYAIARENAFMDNLNRSLKETKVSKAITITGGFHTGGFAERLKESNFSYLIISPRITKFDEVQKEQENYISSLLQLTPKTPSQSLRNRPSPFNVKNALGANPEYVRNELRYAVNETLRNRGTDLSAVRPEGLERLGAMQGAAAEAQKASAAAVIGGRMAVETGPMPILPKPVTGKPVKAPGRERVVGYDDAIQSSASRLLTLGTVIRAILGLEPEVIIPSRFTQQSNIRSDQPEASRVPAPTRIEPTAPFNDELRALIGREDRWNNPEAVSALAKLSGGLVSVGIQKTNEALFEEALGMLNPPEIRVSVSDEVVGKTLGSASVANFKSVQNTDALAVHISNGFNQNEFRAELRIAAMLPRYQMVLIVKGATEQQAIDFKNELDSELTRLRALFDPTQSVDKSQIRVFAATDTTLKMVLLNVLPKDGSDLFGRSVVVSRDLADLMLVSRMNARLHDDIVNKKDQEQHALGLLVYEIASGLQQLDRNRIWNVTELAAYLVTIELIQKGELELLHAA